MKHKQRHRIAQAAVDRVRRNCFKENNVTAVYPLTYEVLSTAIRESFRVALQPLSHLDINKITAALVMWFGVSGAAAAIRVEELRLGVVEEGLL